MEQKIRSIGVFEAKTRLSELLEQIEGGASIVITRHGVPIAKLVPFENTIDSKAVDRAFAKLETTRQAIVRSGGGLTDEQICDLIRKNRP